jgi:hypothetical protein
MYCGEVAEMIGCLCAQRPGGRAVMAQDQRGEASKARWRRASEPAENGGPIGADHAGQGVPQRLGERLCDHAVAVLQPALEGGEADPGAAALVADGKPPAAQAREHAMCIKATAHRAGADGEQRAGTIGKCAGQGGIAVTGEVARGKMREPRREPLRRFRRVHTGEPG